jgi:ParB-like chromosome segregation protein Spo0J
MVANRRRSTKPAVSPWLLSIQFKPLDDLRPDPNNARTHTASQIEIVEKSLVARGWYLPIGEGDEQIVFGHARWTAARNLRDRGIHIGGTPSADMAPVVDLSHLSPRERTALALADNRIAELAGWDTAILAEQIGMLAGDGFDLGSVGFSADDMVAMTVAADPAAVVEIVVAPVADRFWISVRGPLPRQAKALQALRRVMAEIDGITVELGTVMHEDG